jgi:hypothetical protein
LPESLKKEAHLFFATDGFSKSLLAEKMAFSLNIATTLIAQELTPESRCPPKDSEDTMRSLATGRHIDAQEPPKFARFYPSG